MGQGCQNVDRNYNFVSMAGVLWIYGYMDYIPNDPGMS